MSTTEVRWELRGNCWCCNRILPWQTHIGWILQRQKKKKKKEEKLWGMFLLHYDSFKSWRVFMRTLVYVWERKLTEVHPLGSRKTGSFVYPYEKLSVRPKSLPAVTKNWSTGVKTKKVEPFCKHKLQWVQLSLVWTVRREESRSAEVAFEMSQSEQENSFWNWTSPSLHHVDVKRFEMILGQGPTIQNKKNKTSSTNHFHESGMLGHWPVASSDLFTTMERFWRGHTKGTWCWHWPGYKDALVVDEREKTKTSAA